MKLTQHFSLEEMTKSQTASRKGIDNTAPPEVVENLKLLCENVLEYVRVRFGKPITVNSGYRGPKLNKAIGGAKNSQHMTGQAADIEIAGIDNKVLFNWIKDNMEFDQLILEYYKEGIPDSGWVHVSWNSSGNRKQVLTIG
jgi:zinc D-Ala-D-Ala carboxypeptidase